MVGSALSVIDALHFLSLKWDSKAGETSKEEGDSSVPVEENDNDSIEEGEVAKKIRACLLKTIEVSSCDAYVHIRLSDVILNRE